MIKNIFYTSSLTITGGIESFEYNIGKYFVKNENVEIIFLSREISPNMHKLFSNVGKCIRWDGNSKIECDNFFFPSRELKSNLLNKVCAKNIYCCFHMAQAFKWNTGVDKRVTKYIGVSKAACKEWKIATGVECKCYYPIIDINKSELNYNFNKNKKLRLITFARLNTLDKGAKRMLLLANELDRKNIDYEWVLCGDNNNILNNKHFKYLGRMYDKNDIYNELIKSDFAVQLSDAEGFGMSIAESLKLGIPLIATPISVKDEFPFVEGINWIKFDFDGSNVSKVVDDILNRKNIIFIQKLPEGNWEELVCNK